MKFIEFQISDKEEAAVQRVFRGLRRGSMFPVADGEVVQRLLLEIVAQSEHPKRRCKPGVCRRCGCVDSRACPGGCSWADETHTLCSQCVADGEERRR
jgi:hypothetical protein